MRARSCTRQRREQAVFRGRFRKGCERATEGEALEDITMRSDGIKPQVTGAGRQATNDLVHERRGKRDVDVSRR